MNIAGIGIDLLNTSRIEQILMKYGERFAKRILGLQELDEFNNRKKRSFQRGINFLSSRFAAKEAFFKAINLKINIPITWHGVQILNTTTGSPTVVLSSNFSKWYNERYGSAHVSISDDFRLVIAYVVIENLRPPINIAF